MIEVQEDQFYNDWGTVTGPNGVLVWLQMPGEQPPVDPPKATGAFLRRLYNIAPDDPTTTYELLERAAGDIRNLEDPEARLDASFAVAGFGQNTLKSVVPDYRRSVHDLRCLVAGQMAAVVAVLPPDSFAEEASPPEPSAEQLPDADVAVDTLPRTSDAKSAAERTRRTAKRTAVAAVRLPDVLSSVILTREPLAEEASPPEQLVEETVTPEPPPEQLPEADVAADALPATPEAKPVTKRTRNTAGRTAVRSSAGKSPARSLPINLAFPKVLSRAAAAAFLAEQEDPTAWTDWRYRALCRQTDPEAFFPEKGGSTREAKRICSRCEVKDECLEYALGNDERHGVWGGLTERERRKLKRRAA